MGLRLSAPGMVSLSQHQEQSTAQSGEQQAAWLGNFSDPHIVQVSHAAERSDELYVKDVARLRRKVAEGDKRVAIVQPRGTGLLHVDAGRIDQRGVRGVGVNRVDRRVVVAEFM